MRRAAKWTLIGLAIALGAIVALAFAAPVLVPDEFVKRQFAAWVQARTGRDLRIGGPVRVALLPRLALAARDVGLANLPGGETADLFAAQSIELSVALLPLLRGDVVADRVALREVRVNLEIEADGRRNWSFRSSAKAAAPAAPASRGEFFSLAGAHVEIAGGTVGYLDRRSGRHQSVSDIAATLDLPSRAGPAEITAAGVWNDETVRLSATVAAPERLRQGGGSTATITVVAAPFEAEFHGDIAPGRPLRGSGRIALKAPSLRRLLTWWGETPPADLTGLGPLSVAGTIAVAPGKMALSDAAIALDALNASGRLALDRSGGHPLLSGQLAIDRLDLDPYLKPPPAAPALAAPAAPPAPAAPTPTPTPAAALPSAAPFDLAPLKALDAEIGVDAGAIHLRGFDAGRSTLILRLAAARLDLAIAEMALYGGTGAGTITVDSGAAPPNFAAKLDLAGVEVRPLIRALSDLDPLSGKGDLAFDLHAAGNNPRDLFAALAGSGRIALADGALTGFIANPFAALPSADTGKAATSLRYSTLSATYTIANGVVRNGDLKVAAPDMTATGAGTIALAPCRLDYRWLPTITGKGSADLTITGPCEEPTYRAKSLTITKDIGPKDVGPKEPAPKGAAPGGKSAAPSKPRR